MTVAELIEQLSHCPPDAKVIHGNSSGISDNIGRPVDVCLLLAMARHFDRSDPGPFVWLE